MGSPEGMTGIIFDITVGRGLAPAVNATVFEQ